MGYLYLENTVEPVTGKFVGKLELETKSCGHCSAIIAVLVKGCTTEYQSKYTCGRCGESVCKHCAKLMHENGGHCSPVYLKIEETLKTGKWPEYVAWRGGKGRG